MTMTDLQIHITRVHAWAEARGIYEHSTPNAQLGKAVTELGELVCALKADNRDAIADAIGDIRVCLINYCKLMEVEFLDWNQLKSGASDDRVIYSIYLFFAELRWGGDEDYLHSIVRNLDAIASNHGLTVTECDNAAWSQICNRTGQMIDGVFVKDASSHV